MDSTQRDFSMQALIRGRRAWILIALLAAAAALAGVFSLPPLDRDESRFAQATAQMLETGDFVRIRFLDEARHKKPAGIHWLQAASVAVFSSAEAREIWAYRLPSVLGIVLAALAAFWGGSKLVGREAAFAGAALFAVTLLAGVEGGIAKTDAMLAGCTTLAMAALAHLRTGGGRRSAILFWAAIGAGVLIKGPITPLVAALAIAGLALWERKAAWLKPLLYWPGPLLAGLIVLPWLIAVQIATDGAFLREAFMEDFAPKLVSAQERHPGPPGYHLLLLPLLFFPATLFLVPGVARAVSAIRGRGGAETAAAARFLAAWIIPMWLAVEIMPTKLPHYTLPLYPALALLAGWGWATFTQTGRRTRWPSLALYGLGLAVAGGVIYAAVSEFGGAVPIAVIAIAIVAVTGLGAAAEAVRLRPAGALALALAAGLAWHVGARGAAVPSAQDVRLADRARAALSELAAEHGLDPAGLPVISLHMEPSLVFSLGTQTRLAELEAAGELAAEESGAYVTILDTARVEARSIAALEAVSRDVCGAREIAGLNYSRGHRTVLIVQLHGCEADEAS